MKSIFLSGIVCLCMAVSVTATADVISADYEGLAASYEDVLSKYADAKDDTNKRDTVKSDSTVVKVGNVKVKVRKNEENKDEVEISMGAGHDEEEYEDVDSDDPEVNLFNKKKKLKNVKTRWMLLDLGVSAYGTDFGSIGAPDEYEKLDLNYGKSTNVNLHLFRQRINLIKHHLNLQYGISFMFDNYRFSENYTLMSDTNAVVPVGIFETIEKSKLATTFITLPILLNFESYPYDLDKSFRLNVGGFAGYKLEAHTKIKYADGTKIKDRDDFNLNDFRYGLSAQIGYGWFNLYANYSLSTLFNDGLQPELYPLQFGLVIVGF